MEFLQNILTLIFLALAALFLVAFAVRRMGTAGKEFAAGEGSEPQPSYRSRNTLFTPAELNFLEVLRSIIPKAYTVMGKVRLADIISPANTRKDSDYYRDFNRISAKHVDFVICNRQTYGIVAVIELDDATHRRRSRIERDEFLDAALTEAGIGVFHIKARSEYDSEALRKRFAERMPDFAPELTEKEKLAAQHGPRKSPTVPNEPSIHPLELQSTPS